MDLARVWLALALAAPPALVFAQNDAAPRGAEASFSWFTVLAVVVVVAALFVLFSRRRTRRVDPR